MHSFNTLAATAAMAVAVNAQEFIAGNWYTNQVDTIQYTNFGSSGSYNQITNMDSNSGSCSSTPFGYSGSMAPLNGEVSVNIRGPFALKQFAFYTPSAASKAKRDNSAPLRPHKRHANHANFHQKPEEKRQVGAWVTATIDGAVVSWQNQWAGTPTGAPAADSGSSWITATIDGKVVSWQSQPTAAPAADNAPAPAASTPTAAAHNIVNNGANNNNNNNADNGDAAAASSTAAAAAPSSAPADNSGGAYSRQAYYDSASQTAQGLTFLNHMGGQGSGVFDYTFGNSLSYASADALSGAASSTILADTTLPSDSEIVIMTDKSCSDGGCGYTRPGTVAYHGFDGASKIFLFEFSMPSDGTTGFNADMPALWLLNAQIPNTIQYGPADCSCWTSGCGEFDIMEVLDSGDTRCKSTMHGGISGGDSAYIQRPTGAPIKLALVMSDSTATIKVLDDSFDIGSGLSQSQVDDISSSSSIGGLLASLFNLGG